MLQALGTSTGTFRHGDGRIGYGWRCQAAKLYETSSGMAWVEPTPRSSLSTFGYLHASTRAVSGRGKLYLNLVSMGARYVAGRGTRQRLPGARGDPKPRLSTM